MPRHPRLETRTMGARPSPVHMQRCSPADKGVVCNQALSESSGWGNQLLLYPEMVTYEACIGEVYGVVWRELICCQAIGTQEA